MKEILLIPFGSSDYSHSYLTILKKLLEGGNTSTVVANFGNFIFDFFPDEEFIKKIIASIDEKFKSIVCVVPINNNGIPDVLLFIFEGKHSRMINQYHCFHFFGLEKNLITMISWSLQVVLRDSNVSFDRASFLNSRDNHQTELEEFLLLMGIEYAKSEKFNLARIAWQTIVDDVNIKSTKAYLNLGQSFCDEGLYDEGLDWFEIALNHSIDDGDKTILYYNIGNAYLNLKKYNEAIESYKLCITVDETFGFAYNDIGYCHIQLNEFTLAREWLDFCLKLEFDSSSPLGSSKEAALKNLKSLN